MAIDLCDIMEFDISSSVFFLSDHLLCEKQVLFLAPCIPEAARSIWKKDPLQKDWAVVWCSVFG
ncbi:MAG: hypothetical protein IJ333_07090 [Clostridia bacterium]|nr:hypothetical protein [Clostridia bacterium]